MRHCHSQARTKRAGEAEVLPVSHGVGQDFCAFGIGRFSHQKLLEPKDSLRKRLPDRVRFGSTEEKGRVSNNRQLLLSNVYLVWKNSSIKDAGNVRGDFMEPQKYL